MTDSLWDVIVVGGGKAAMCAALSARERGVRVLVVEGARDMARRQRLFHRGRLPLRLQELRRDREIVGDLSDGEAASMVVKPYTEDDFYDDLMRVTEDLADPDLTSRAVVFRREDLPQDQAAWDQIFLVAFGSPESRPPESAGSDLRVAQPSGVVPVAAAVRREGDDWVAEHVVVYRTARRLMDGFVLVPASAMAGA